MKTDICIVGGSLGGVLAAYAAAKDGKKVILTEITDWIGGQLTSQAVPPDEHPWIEQYGATRSYHQFRQKLRDFYLQNYPVKEEVKRIERFNIGNSSVSRIAHEPKVALHLLNEMLLPFTNSGRLKILLNHRITDCTSSNKKITSVVVEDIRDKHKTIIEADYFIDATETGDLLPLSKTDFTCGAESREMTGEPHAAPEYEPRDMQPVTWVAAADYKEGENHTIEKPENYDFWKNQMQTYDKYPVFSWYGPDSVTGKARKFGMFTPGKEELFPLWDYRRIVYKDYFKDEFYDRDIVLINWPQNDYFHGNVFDDPDSEKHLENAKELTLSFIYWLQTEAPREDGGFGYPGIRLRGDVLGTDDGLAKYPYIRESRRIKGEFTVTENHIGKHVPSSKAKFKDTVGVAFYHMDLHITTVSHQFTYYDVWPYEIPLGAMIPVKTQNLIAGCKNISTTHLTNGCYRVHPAEWNIGEVAGYLASTAIDKRLTPSEIRNNNTNLTQFQQKLEEKGVELHWPDKMGSPLAYEQI